MKKTFAIVLVVCMLLSFCGCGKKATIEGKGFETPEEAMIAFAEAIRSGDMDQILSVHAVETYVDRYDLEAYIDYIHSYLPTMDCPMPNTDANTRAMNIVFRQNTIARQQQYLYLVVALGESYEPATIVVAEGNEYSSASKLVRDLTEEDWLDILAEMEVGDLADYRDLDIEKNTWKEAEKRSSRPMCDYLGCDEITGMAVEITLDGEDYYLCADLVCYDGVWYVYKACGTIGTLAGADIRTGLLPR